MSLISRNDLIELANFHESYCISIFIPTHRAGQEVLQSKDSIVLKNQLKEVKDKLKHKGFSENEIEEIQKPVIKLINDKDFWHHQSDGLAIFLSPNKYKEYILPVGFEAFNYLSHEFYLKPLMPMFVGDGKFFILSLELEDVKLYEAERHSIEEVIIDDLIPSGIEESAGLDYKQKSLQFRSQKEDHGNATFHGHGEGKDDRKIELKNYFRSIDKGIMTLLHDENLPMVIACQNHLYSSYKEVNSYKHLLSEHISSNPADMDVLFLHENAWEIVSPVFDKECFDHIERFRKDSSGEKTSIEIGKIIESALMGKIDILFLQNRTDIWGVYDPVKTEVKLQDMQRAPNISLMNLAAIKTFINGGKVYLLEQEEMPNPNSKVNAIFRY